ncbi:hypothetical protein M2347_002675 [Chryseobacterium sp. H1D6B]|uniref:hypothetical protein n=1 Tax=Chryseobacterium sp. H1D6B TaxID=2940588 RepID=UPI0015CD6179|nr:hypothetical protein [Chryseobacterium sp. H1D6B]MDH6252948.1 hypothetical protein [Chryseobacterium sp. H1D6B]
MDYNFYHKKFQSALDEIPKKKFDDAGLQLAVDAVLESIVLKIYKPGWSSDLQSPLNALSRIFFSVWISDQSIAEGRIYYNIHAFKLRHLKGYKIASRSFAEVFRHEFLNHQKDWPNVEVKYGPLTLMQGWIELREDNIHSDLLLLAKNFLKSSPLIDETLQRYKVTK